MKDKKNYVMMEPPIDSLIQKVGNKFAMTCLVAKRAKALSNEYLLGEPDDTDPKFIATAAEEVYEGKVIVDDSKGSASA